MITVLTAITPLMMATPVEQPITIPEAPIAYNWETQNANNLISDEDVKAGAMASFCSAPGSRIGMPQVVDDWHLA